MKIALIQMVSGTQVAANLEAAALGLQAAAQADAQLVLLPEYFACMGQHEHDKLAQQEPFGQGPVQAFLSEQARRLGLWLVGGSLPLTSPDPQRVYNSTLVFDPQGQCVARYDKMHLFRLDDGAQRFDETKLVRPGQAPVAVDLVDRAGQRWKLGLSICYDLRFPELYRSYAAQGADIMVVPSAFTYTTGKAHWELLLRARAVENLSYVLAPAQGGMHENGRQTWGHSMAVSPWGEVLAQQAQGQALVLAQLDPAQLVQARARLPALAHRTL